MARTVDEINAYIVAKMVTNFADAGITIDPTQWSKRNLLRAICYTAATAIAILEQLNDVFMVNIEAVADRAPAASPNWIQDKMFKFQYSATDPQVIALIDTIPQYPVLRTDLRIITACSITSSVSNEERIKVAKGNPFVPLDGPQIAAAQGYINIIGIAGITYVVISLDSDKLFVEADVYFQGQYAAVIQARMIAAIEAWFVDLATNQFNGAAEVSDLEVIMKAVPGVNDVVLKNVRGRADTDPFSAGIDLVLNNAVVLRKWQTIAGYIGQETDAGHTFADSLTFIAE